MGREQELLKACEEGKADVVEKLISSKKGGGKLASFRRGPSVNARDATGYTPLHFAALRGHYEVCQILLKHEANANARDNKGSCPLHLAAWSGHDRVAQLLLTGRTTTTRASANSQAQNGETALHSAAQHGNAKVLALLLKSGADPTKRNKNDESPLDLAAQFGRTDCVELLLVHSPKLLESQTEKHTPLHLAARNGHADVVQLLLKHGMDINAVSKSGTALHEAALFGKADVAKELLDAGIDLNKAGPNNQTAIELVENMPGRKAQAIHSLLSAKVEGNSVAQDRQGFVQAIAVMDYMPSVYDDSALSFKKGDSVQILEQNDSGWWRGTVHSRTGVFPHTYVELRVASGSKASSSGAPAAAAPAAAAPAVPAAAPTLAPAVSAPVAMPASPPAAAASQGPANPFNPFLTDSSADPTSPTGVEAAADFFGALAGGTEPFSSPAAAAEPADPEATGLSAPGAPPPEEKPTTVPEWLTQSGHAGQLGVFIASGYDVLGFVPFITAGDLAAMGIPEEVQASLLQSAKSLPALGFEEASTVGFWLSHLGLFKYANAFEAAGYRTMSHLASLDEASLTPLGIMLRGHVALLLQAAASLKASYPDAAKPSDDEGPLLVHYMGSIVAASGDAEALQQSLEKMKHSGDVTKPPIILQISSSEVTFVDKSSGVVMVTQATSSVCAVLASGQEDGMFGYTTKEVGSTKIKYYCHTFSAPGRQHWIVNKLKGVVQDPEPGNAQLNVFLPSDVGGAELAPVVEDDKAGYANVALAPEPTPENGSTPSAGAAAPSPFAVDFDASAYAPDTNGAAEEAAAEAERAAAELATMEQAAAEQAAAQAEAAAAEQAAELAAAEQAAAEAAQKEAAAAAAAAEEAAAAAAEQAAAAQAERDATEAARKAAEDAAFEEKMRAVQAEADAMQAALAEAEEKQAEMERQEEEANRKRQEREDTERKEAEAAREKAAAAQAAAKEKEAAAAAKAAAMEKDGKFVSTEERLRMAVDEKETESRLSEMTFNFSFGSPAAATESSTDPEPEPAKKEREVEEAKSKPQLKASPPKVAPKTSPKPKKKAAPVVPKKATAPKATPKATPKKETSPTKKKEPAKAPAKPSEAKMDKAATPAAASGKSDKEERILALKAKLAKLKASKAS